MLWKSNVLQSMYPENLRTQVPVSPYKSYLLLLQNTLPYSFVTLFHCKTRRLSCMNSKLFFWLMSLRCMNSVLQTSMSYRVGCPCTAAKGCTASAVLHTSVSLEPRKGTWRAEPSRALIHSFKARRLLLISAPSKRVCLQPVQAGTHLWAQARQSSWIYASAQTLAYDGHTLQDKPLLMMYIWFSTNPCL